MLAQSSETGPGFTGRLFVTVGNATQPFPRLLHAVEELARDGSIRGTVVMQTGSTPFQSELCVTRSHLAPNEFQSEIDCADVVICHAGAGAMLHVLESGKTPIVMPRRRIYNEHVDDHQLELATTLAEARRIILVCNAAEIAAALSSGPRVNASLAIKSAPDRVIRAVAAAIQELTLGG